MKKTFTLRILELAIILIAVLAFLTGCHDTPRHLAIVYAACENNPVPAVGGQLYEAISETADSFGSTMSVFVADSSNSRSFYQEFAAPKMNVSESRKATIKKNYTSLAFNALSEAKAQADEVDLLGTISQAARQLRSDRQEGEKAVMIVIASGLSTTYPLDFTKGYLTIEAQQTVQLLKETDTLPDLSFVDSIIWIGLGDTVAPQDKPTASNIKKLREIWTDILGECGCKHISFAPDLASGEKKQSEYHVKTVEITRNEIDEIDLTMPTFFESIRFVSFTTDFKNDREEVKNTLAPFADYLKKHPQMTAVLAGQIARYGKNDDSAKAFSLKRAAAVRRVFVEELGVNPEQIVICGLGWTPHKYRQTDDFGNEKAEDNRSTIIVSRDTEAGELFLRIGVHE